MKTFLEHIQTNSELHPDTVAIRLNNEQVTYRELYTKMVSVAHNADLYGMSVGSKVLFACKPDPESLTIALGLLLNGVTIVILDPFTSNTLFVNRGNKANITHILADSALYQVSKHRKMMSKVMKKPVADILSLGVPTYSLGKHKNSPNVRRWLETTGVTNHEVPNPNEPAIIVFTSGTTSEPKGVVHTLNSLSANIEDFSTLFNIQAGGVVYSEPMTLGLIALSKGSTWVIPGKERTIPDCDVWFGTPVEILNGLQKSVKTKVGIIGSGSAPVLPSLVQQVEKQHPDTKIFCVYGMTEMLPIAVGDAKKKTDYVDQGDYIGAPLPSTKIDIDSGEVVVSGAGLMKTYLGQPEAVTLPTGDYGKLLPSGELILLGRKKTMYIRNDMNVYPGLYEPGVSTIEGVNEVALVGLPDQYGDDELILVITPQSGYSDTFVHSNVMNEMYKFFDTKAIPSEVIVLDSLPKNGRANKTDREAIVDIICERRREGLR